MRNECRSDLIFFAVLFSMDFVGRPAVSDASDDNSLLSLPRVGVVAQLGQVISTLRLARILKMWSCFGGWARQTLAHGTRRVPRSTQFPR